MRLLLTFHSSVDMFTILKKNYNEFIILFYILHGKDYLKNSKTIILVELKIH